MGARETLIVSVFKLLVVIFVFALMPLLLLNHSRGTYLKFWMEAARAEGLGCLLVRLEELVPGWRGWKCCISIIEAMEGNQLYEFKEVKMSPNNTYILFIADSILQQTDRSSLSFYSVYFCHRCKQMEMQLVATSA